MSQTGLANLGNTCFLNSCLQVLNHTFELNNLKILNTELPDSIFFKEWSDLKTMMCELKEGIIAPNRFIHIVQTVSQKKNRILFTGWGQNDVCEFLLLWMECAHNSMSRKLQININGKEENNKDKMAIQCYKYLKDIYSKEYSEMYDLFYGIYMTTIYDKENQQILSMTPEHFFILDLQLFDINNSFNNIYQSFDHYVNSENMSGENAWFNEKTGEKEEINKVTTFWNLPKVLVICLKRFATDGKRKLQYLVNFPLTDLNLSKYVNGYNAEQYVYDLYGVCNHFGGVQGGHYTAFVKNSQNKWLHFNDTNVENANESQIVSNSAYCLFYRKKDSN
uniref:USP domain-containing protein n=1 Tax=viral metagenome TaxID=1070528 RepID=A0A6C0HZ85_9ZZZZ